MTSPSSKLLTLRRAAAAVLLAIMATGVACAGGGRSPRHAENTHTDERPSVDAGTSTSVDDDASASDDASGTGPACPAPDGGVGVVDVYVQREPLSVEPGSPVTGAVFVVIPALGVREKWLDLVGPVDCGGAPRHATPRLTLSCSYLETTLTLDLAVESGAIVSSATVKNYDGKRSRPAVRPIELPCGAKVEFHALRYRDPAWSRMGSACFSGCADGHDKCLEPCEPTDEHDELGRQGAACIQKCDQALLHCTRKCPP